MTDKKNPKAEQKGDNILNFMKGFMIFADLGNDTLEDRVKTKERIVFATMRKLIYGWEKPKDWDSLTDEVKMERLDKLQNMDV